MSTKLTKEQNDFVNNFKNGIINAPGVMELIKDEIANYKEKEFTEIDINTVKILKDYIDKDLCFTDEDKKMISNDNVNQIIVTLIFNLVSLVYQSTVNKMYNSDNCRIYFDEVNWGMQNIIIAQMKELTKQVYLNMSK